jgi:hypothetical protein
MLIKKFGKCVIFVWCLREVQHNEKAEINKLTLSGKYFYSLRQPNFTKMMMNFVLNHKNLEKYRKPKTKRVIEEAEINIDKRTAGDKSH